MYCIFDFFVEFGVDFFELMCGCGYGGCMFEELCFVGC